MTFFLIVIPGQLSCRRLSVPSISIVPGMDESILRWLGHAPHLDENRIPRFRSAGCGCVRCGGSRGAAEASQAGYGGNRETRSRNSLAGSTPMTLHHRIEVLNQCPRVERLTQDAGCSGFQCLRPDSLFGESRDENHRQLAPLRLQKILQLDAAHARHLNVRDHAGGMIQLGGSQKFACRRKCSGNVSKRAHEPVSRGAN
jgi:hypothetical protein